MDKQNQAKRYQHIKNRLFFLELALNAFILWGIMGSGLSVFLRKTAFAFNANFMIANAIYILFFSALFFIIHFPLDFFEGYYLEHQFQLSHQTIGGWARDHLKKTIMGLILTLIFVSVIYIFLHIFPQKWWLFGALFWLFLAVVLTKITPQVIVPLFYPYQRISNEALCQRIYQLFRKCQMPLKEIYMVNFSQKTKKVNAFICGWGKSRRVVLSDTLVKEFSPEEIEVVVAHELGHYKNRDIFKLTVINTIFILGGFYLVQRFLRLSLPWFGLEALDDIAFFPIVVLAFSILGLLMMPLLNAVTKFLEKKADIFALQQTANPTAFISVMQKLASINLADTSPSRFEEIFFYDHPPINKRIALAQQMPVGDKGEVSYV